MPPDEPLSSHETAILADWVKMGAPWPESAVSEDRKPGGKISAEDRGYWAFQPRKEPPVPVVVVEN